MEQQKTLSEGEQKNAINKYNSDYGLMIVKDRVRLCDKCNINPYDYEMDNGFLLCSDCATKQIGAKK